MKYAGWLAIVALTATMLACSIFVGGPTYPEPPAAPSGEATQGLQTQVERALADSAQTGTLTLEFTEAQLTDYVASTVGTQPNPVISEPQVQLRDGLMTVNGKVQTGIFLANARITTQFSVDQSGKPQIEITQADLGPLRAPEALRTAISASLRETFTGALGPAAIGFRLQSIHIADGTMTITGSVR
jgi:hypothetical protein